MEERVNRIERWCYVKIIYTPFVKIVNAISKNGLTLDAAA